MNTKYLRGVFAFFVSLVMLTGIIPSFGLSPLRAYADDLSGRVGITDFDLLKKDGTVLISGTSENPSDYTDGMNYGDTFGMKVNFTVSKTVPSQNFKDGDIITFDYPLLTDNVSKVEPTPFYSNIGGSDVAIGTWSTEIITEGEGEGAKQHGKVTITLNDKAITYDELTGAWVKIPIVGVSHTNNWTADQIREVTVGGITHKYKVNKREPVPARPLTDIKDAKFGTPGSTTTSITWQIYSGYELLNNLHTANGGPGTTEKPLTAKNILIDTLADSAGHKATAVTKIEIGTNGVAPYGVDDSHGNANVQKYFVVTDLFTRTDGAYPAYATLDAYVAALPVNNYGVYTAQDGTLSAVMNMGELGKDTPLWSQAASGYISTIADYARYNGYCLDVDGEALKAAIDKIYGTGNGIGGRINSLGMNITAEYPESIVPVTYSNTATSTVSGDLTNTYTITPPASGSNVEPYEIKVMKYDSVTGVAIEGVKVKLQKKNDNGTWSDTTGNVSDTNQKETDASGVASWKEVPPGTYRVIEVEAAPGYELGTVDETVGGVVATDEIQVPEHDDAGHIMKVQNVKKTAPTVSTTLNVQKTLFGGTLAADQFSFTITAADGTPLPAVTTVKNKADGTVPFGDITYTAAGIYTYAITEDTFTDVTIQRDPRTYTVTVTVEEVGGALTVASVTYAANEINDINNVPSRTDAAVFANRTYQVGYEMAKFRTMDAPATAAGDKFGFAQGTKGVTYKVALVNTGELPLTMDVEDVFTTGAANFENVKVVGSKGYHVKAFISTATASLADITAMELVATPTTDTKVNSSNGPKANVTIQPGSTLVIDYTADVKADAVESLDDTKADDIKNPKANTDGYTNTVSTSNVKATYGSPAVTLTQADFPVALASKQDTAQTPVQKKTTPPEKPKHPDEPDTPQESSTPPPSVDTPTPTVTPVPVVVRIPRTGDSAMPVGTALTALASALALAFVVVKKKSAK